MPKTKATGLFRVRSPLLTESPGGGSRRHRESCSRKTLLMSVPPATEMFQFAGFASSSYEFRSGYPCGWVAPFGDPGITDRSHLPRAFRSVPRPSSPLSAKASTRCPYLATPQPPPRTGPKLDPRESGDPYTAASHEDTSSDRSGASLACAALGRQRRWRYADRRSLAPPIGDRRRSASPKGGLAARAYPPPRVAPQRRRVLFSEPEAPGRVAPGGASRRNPLSPAGWSQPWWRCPLVEVNGIEPMTSCLQSRRSPN